MHKKIKYSYLSKNQSRYVCRASGVMKKQIKLLAHKTWNSVILGYLLKDKSMKEVLLAMDIITTFSTQ